MNAFNQKPIRISTSMTQTFWQTLRGLGVLAPSHGKPINVKSITWIDPGPGASVIITDGSQNQNVLFERDTNPDFVGGDLQYLFVENPKRWRDWQATIQGGEIEIDYV